MKHSKQDEMAERSNDLTRQSTGQETRRLRRQARCRWSLAASLLALLCLIAISPERAAAQINFSVSTNPDVALATTGLSEVLGSITLTGGAGCGTTADGLCTSIASTLQVNYTNVTIDNAVGSGIQVCE